MIRSKYKLGKNNCSKVRVTEMKNHKVEVKKFKDYLINIL